MARVIEFYARDLFLPKGKSVPRDRRGKVIQFPSSELLRTMGATRVPRSSIDLSRIRLPTHLAHPLKDEHAVVIHALWSSLQRSRQNCSKPCRLLQADISGCGFVVVTTRGLLHHNTQGPIPPR